MPHGALVKENIAFKGSFCKQDNHHKLYTGLNDKLSLLFLLENKISFAPLRPAGFVNFCRPWHRQVPRPTSYGKSGWEPVQARQGLLFAAQSLFPRGGLSISGWNVENEILEQLPLSVGGSVSESVIVSGVMQALRVATLFHWLFPECLQGDVVCSV